MLTIFSIPKPFAGHIGLIQRNALASWRRLGSDVEIVLMGSDAGVADAAREFGCAHEADIAVNTFGTPSITDAFRRARARARHGLLLYTNTDILYDASLLEAARNLSATPAFVAAGQRWDLTVERDLTSATDSEWQVLFATRAAHGQLHGPAGIDYILFPQKHDLQMPDFAVGRVGWDSWLVWSTRARGLPMIDATHDLIALHQAHDYASLKLGYQHAQGPERDLNIRAAGGLSRLLTLREANYHLINGATVPPPRWLLRITSALGPTWPYRKLLALKRSFL